MEQELAKRDAEIAALREENKRLRKELEKAKAFERSVNEALNSGDGSYRP